MQKKSNCLILQHIMFLRLIQPLDSHSLFFSFVKKLEMSFLGLSPTLTECAIFLGLFSVFFLLHWIFLPFSSSLHFSSIFSAVFLLSLFFMGKLVLSWLFSPFSLTLISVGFSTLGLFTVDLGFPFCLLVFIPGFFACLTSPEIAWLFFPLRTASLS